MRNFLRRFFLSLVFVTALFGFTGRVSGQENIAAPYKKTFIVTGYYSPLPNQSMYVTGSYEGDVRLNGEGVHSADGSLVFPGMIAAPREFPFGTKIFIPGVGLGEVRDRGGAIKRSRLDVWMGYGEEGLQRALGWGIREVEGTVYGLDPTIAVAIDISNLPLAKNIGLYVRTKYFRHDLTLGDNGGEIEELQHMLKKLGFFSNEINGFYGEETKRAVYQFQAEKNILTAEEAFGAGHFGPRTRVTLEREIEARKNDIHLAPHTLQRGDRGENIRAMQEALSLVGFLASVNGEYDDGTADAVFEFQRKHGIVLRRDEYGATVLGPRTREALEYEYRFFWTPNAQKLEIPDRGENEFRITAVFQKEIKLGDRGEMVTRLQEELRKLHFLRVEPTGYFGNVTEHAVFKFQQTMGLVGSQKDPGAGYVGPKTRDKLNAFIAKREQQNRDIVRKSDSAKRIAKQTEEEQSLLAQALQTSQNSHLEQLLHRDITYGDTGREVRSLQEILKKLGYFQGHIVSDYFGDLTRSALLKFQLQHGLIESEEDENAGRFDEQTKEKLTTLIYG